MNRNRFALLPLFLCMLSPWARASLAAALLLAAVSVMASAPAAADDAPAADSQDSTVTRTDSPLTGAVDFSVDTPPAAGEDGSRPEEPAAGEDGSRSEEPAAVATPAAPAHAPAAAPGHAPAVADAAGHPAPAHGGNPWTPSSALIALKDGNARFVGGGVSCRDPHASRTLRQELAAEGQTPLAAILSCSDSRAPVEDVFDLGFGDIFSIRAAGSVPGVDQLGSIEYAVAHLGVPLVVVLAHTKCGAVTAAVQGANEPGNLGELLHKLDPISQAVQSVPDDKIKAAVFLSARRFSEQLPELSPVIKEALEAGRIQIIDAVYDIDTGQVLFHQQQQQ
ncbi:MAG: carbonic anhydrase [Deltaproteobacteria bacterium]|jgi:carbonic anhydrase|nr:carbonic anhydrase [Deltaproteobacteria bacterium]